MVPMGGEQWQFFLGNTRRSRQYRLRQELAVALRQLDGQLTLAEVARRTGADLECLEALARALHASCILEDDGFAQWAIQSPWRRLLNFLGDYIPSDGVKDVFARLSETEVIVLGVGAVGSWVATQLCQSGVERLSDQATKVDLAERASLDGSTTYRAAAWRFQSPFVQHRGPSSHRDLGEAQEVRKGRAFVDCVRHENPPRIHHR